MQFQGLNALFVGLKNDLTVGFAAHVAVSVTLFTLLAAGAAHFGTNPSDINCSHVELKDLHGNDGV